MLHVDVKKINRSNFLYIADVTENNPANQRWSHKEKYERCRRYLTTGPVKVPLAKRTSPVFICGCRREMLPPSMKIRDNACLWDLATTWCHSSSEKEDLGFSSSLCHNLKCFKPCNCRCEELFSWSLFPTYKDQQYTALPIKNWLGKIQFCVPMETKKLWSYYKTLRINIPKSAYDKLTCLCYILIIRSTYVS